MASAKRQSYSTHPEVVSPVPTRVEGTLPSWLNGSFVRIGPGLFEFGKNEAAYPMDGMGMLHAFHIQDGQVTFNRRLIGSNILKKNMEAQRYVASEFGTAFTPDPKLSAFGRLKEKMVGSGDLSDNSTHNVFYWKENNVLLVAGQPLFVINPQTLETVNQVKLPEKLGFDLVAEHVYIDKDGTLYLLATHVRGKPTYNVVKVPPTGDIEKSFAAAEVVFTANGQFKITPTSHHTFIMTDNYFVIVECPFQINVLKILAKSTIYDALSWDPSVTSKFYIYNRKTGQTMKQKMDADAFLLVHIANAYDDGDHIVVDATTCRDFTKKDLFVTRKVLNSEAFEKEKPWKAGQLHKAVRFVIPTNVEAISAKKTGENCVCLPTEEAEAIVAKSILRLKSRPLTAPREDVENLYYPCINLSVARQQYTYFYAGGTGESEYLRFGIGKFNVNTKEVVAWEAKEYQFLTEPQFIADPEGTAEDDGVLLFTMLDYAEDKDRMVVVDAKSMTTIAQVYLDAETSTHLRLPEGDHGVFVPSSA